MLEALRKDSRLDRLDKQGQDLVLAFAEALTKRGAGGDGARGAMERLRKSVHVQKSNPLASDVHVSTELTDLSIAYMNDQGSYAASQTGIIPVEHQAGQYNEYDKGDLFRDEAKPRPPSTEATRGGVRVGQGTYSCTRSAYRRDVDDELIANQKAGDPRDDALADVTQKILIRKENVWATNLFATGLWTTDLDGVSSGPGASEFVQYDQSASTPREDFHGDAITIHEASGQWPNVLTLSPHVLKSLLLHADVVDAFKHTQAGATPSMEGLARALFAGFGNPTPQIRVAGAIQNTAEEGATDSLSYIASKHALLAYVNPNPSLRSASAWYVFSWADEVFGTNEMGVRIREFEDVPRSVPTVVEGEFFIDIKLVAADLGVFREDAVA